MVRKSGDTSETTAVETIDGFGDGDLGELDSFAAILEKTGGEVPTISDVLGNGFGVCEDKAVLIGVEFIIVKYGIHDSETTGKQFSSIHIVTLGGDKFIVNDGSTGIHVQLGELKEKLGNVCPMHVKKGLRVSEYDYEDDNGAKKRAKTYYLSTAK